MSQMMQRRDPAIWENLRRNIGNIGNVTIQKQMQDIQRKQAMQDAIRKAIVGGVTGGKLQAPAGFDPYGEGQLDLSQFEQIQPPPTTSITFADIPYSEKLKARTILGRTPEEWGKKDMADIKGGRFGFGERGLGSKWVLRPQAEEAIKEAEELLESPQRTTRRVSGKFRGGFAPVLSQFTGGAGAEAELPDPADYEEGTVIDVDGVEYELQQGEWIQLSETRGDIIPGIGG